MSNETDPAEGSAATKGGEPPSPVLDAGSLDGALAWVRRAAWDTPTPDQRADEVTIPEQYLGAIERVLTRKYRAIAARLVAERWPTPATPREQGTGEACGTCDFDGAIRCPAHGPAILSALPSDPVSPRPVDDARARQLVSDLATIGRHVGEGYSLRIERYRDDPEDAVYAILKWDMSGTAGIIAWKSEAVGRAPTMADAVHDAVAQTGWIENPRGEQHADPAQP